MKLASAVICILFTYVNVVHGAVEAGSSFWRSRKEAVEKMSKQPEAPSLAQETLLAQLPSINPQSFTGLTSAMNSRVSASNALPTPIAAQIPVANMKLPLEFANLKSANFPAGWKNNDLTVIRIQDVHMNVEAQSNISKSIQGLIDQGKVDFVALEGAFEEIDVSGFRAFEDQVAIRMVAEYFLKENKISGAIHAALTDSSNIPPFVGVDDKVLHTSHINSYKEAVKHADEQKARLKNEVASTEAEKAKLFNPHLLAFDKDVQAYRSGSLQMGDYVKSLIKHNVPISQVEIFLKALAMEKSLDFSQVEKERAFLIQKLVYNISKNNISELLNVSLSYRLGKLRHTDFYVYLRTLCGKENLDLKNYPAMDQYIQYVLLSDGIKAEKFLAEIQAMETAGYEKLVQSESERDLISHSREQYLEGKLLDFALSPAEWGEYSKKKRNSGLASFESFFNHAALRDKALSANLLTEAKAKNARIAVLVTGGYHTEGMAEIFKNENIAVVTLAPKITKIEGKSGTEYLSIFTQDKTPLEKLFDGDKLFVNAAAFEPKDVAMLGATGVAVSMVRGGLDIPLEEQQNTFRAMTKRLTDYSVKILVVAGKLVVNLYRKGSASHVEFVVTVTDSGIDSISSQRSAGVGAFLAKLGLRGDFSTSLMTLTAPGHNFNLIQNGIARLFLSLTSIFTGLFVLSVITGFVHFPYVDNVWGRLAAISVSTSYAVWGFWSADVYGKREYDVEAAVEIFNKSADRDSFMADSQRISAAKQEIANRIDLDHFTVDHVSVNPLEKMNTVALGKKFDQSAAQVSGRKLVVADWLAWLASVNVEDKSAFDNLHLKSADGKPMDLQKFKVLRENVLAFILDHHEKIRLQMNRNPILRLFSKIPGFQTFLLYGFLKPLQYLPTLGTAVVGILVNGASYLVMLAGMKAFDPILMTRPIMELSLAHPLWWVTLGFGFARPIWSMFAGALLVRVFGEKNKVWISLMMGLEPFPIILFFLMPAAAVWLGSFWGVQHLIAVSILFSSVAHTAVHAGLTHYQISRDAVMTAIMGALENKSPAIKSKGVVLAEQHADAIYALHQTIKSTQVRGARKLVSQKIIEISANEHSLHLQTAFGSNGFSRGVMAAMSAGEVGDFKKALPTAVRNRFINDLTNPETLGWLNAQLILAGAKTIEFDAAFNQAQFTETLTVGAVMSPASAAAWLKQNSPLLKDKHAKVMLFLSDVPNKTEDRALNSAINAADREGIEVMIDLQTNEKLFGRLTDLSVVKVDLSVLNGLAAGYEMMVISRDFIGGDLFEMSQYSNLMKLINNSAFLIINAALQDVVHISQEDLLKAEQAFKLSQ